MCVSAEGHAVLAVMEGCGCCMTGEVVLVSEGPEPAPGGHQTHKAYCVKATSDGIL